MIGDTGPTTGTTGGFILHGGVSPEVGSLGDTWRWSSGSWSKIREFGPPPRSGHALSYDSERNRIVSENFRSGPTPSQQPTE
jgi:hypothetical protein